LGWDAVDAGGVRRLLALDETLSAYGEVVWSWRRDAGAKPVEQSAGDGDNKPAHRGEHDISRKAIAQGMSECSPLPCMLVCAFLCATGTRDRGCSAHPAFPAPSILKRDNEFGKARAHGVARTLIHTHSSSPGLTGRPSIPEAAVKESRSGGVLGTPHARGTTVEATYRGARFAKIRCRVRRCMFSRRAVSETLRLHIS
jgi:hypothetical protein